MRSLQRALIHYQAVAYIEPVAISRFTSR